MPEISEGLHLVTADARLTTFQPVSAGIPAVMPDHRQSSQNSLRSSAVDRCGAFARIQFSFVRAPAVIRVSTVLPRRIVVCLLPVAQPAHVNRGSARTRLEHPMSNSLAEPLFLLALVLPPVAVLAGAAVLAVTYAIEASRRTAKHVAKAHA